MLSSIWLTLPCAVWRLQLSLSLVWKLAVFNVLFYLIQWAVNLQFTTNPFCCSKSAPIIINDYRIYLSVIRSQFLAIS
jgi:hypothetical protein